ncbi:MAG: hypothetical protein BGO40_10720 [Chryseobacterium sp. 39-10]|nr:MAG: hypothetical protein BGO40_10720 [Chryseobacterium sp. 39-10]
MKQTPPIEIQPQKPKDCSLSFYFRTLKIVAFPQFGKYFFISGIFILSMKQNASARVLAGLFFLN